MPLIKHDTKDINHLEQLILKSDGSPLAGEIDMYRRICRDCQDSSTIWHFWHDLRLPISCNNQSEIQIDFLLVCKYGAVVIEVKGGGININEGNYYYVKNGIETLIDISPFDQADNYKWSLINNKIFNKDQLFIETVVAFPHSSINRTNIDPKLDQSWKLWSQNNHNLSTQSFADFCINVIRKSQIKKTSILFQPLENDSLKLIINKLLPTFKEKNPYTEANLQSILNWLNIDNINTLESLSHNQRIVIQGGAGTGKTTIAKAFIKKHNTLNGLYLCWNKLLAKKIEKELKVEQLNKCEVYQYQSFFLKKQIGSIIKYEDFTNPKSDDYCRIVQSVISSIKRNPDFICYDYVIIDEAQDVFDKGVDIILNELVSVRGRGLEDGQFLVFYDTDQGYNNDNRKLSEYADFVSTFAAHFRLNDNKRVPTNKEIIEYAYEILAFPNEKSISEVFYQISKRENIAVKIKHFVTTKELIKYLRITLNKICSAQLDGKDYVLLGHSNLQYIESENGETIFNRLYGIDVIEEVNENNINSLSNRVMPFTTILRYKGLESNNVILIVKDNAQLDRYEMYVGMTRAIMSLTILILD